MTAHQIYQCEKSCMNDESRFNENQVPLAVFFIDNFFGQLLQT